MRPVYLIIAAVILGVVLAAIFFIIKFVLGWAFKILSLAVLIVPIAGIVLYLTSKNRHS